jgi:ATP-dependent DNA ligase
VSKLTIAPYRSGRTKTWLKTKCLTEANFMVIGTDRDRKTGALRALLAHSDSAGLIYAGAAFTLLDVQWCKPALVVRVKHLAGRKTLRHATVRGFAS